MIEIFSSSVLPGLQILAQSPNKVSLRANVSYFLFSREAKEIGNVCAQAKQSTPFSMPSLDPPVYVSEEVNSVLFVITLNAISVYFLFLSFTYLWKWAEKGFPKNTSKEICVVNILWKLKDLVISTVVSEGPILLFISIKKMCPMGDLTRVPFYFISRVRTFYLRLFKFASNV